jgi:hypothetical protein
LEKNEAQNIKKKMKQSTVIAPLGVGGLWFFRRRVG